MSEVKDNGGGLVSGRRILGGQNGIGEVRVCSKSKYIMLTMNFHNYFIIAKGTFQCSFGDTCGPLL